MDLKPLPAFTKITCEIPTAYYRKIKIYAAVTNQSFREVMTRMLHEGLKKVEQTFSFPEEPEEK